MLLRLLEQKFGPPSDEVKARVRAASVDELDRWLDRILDARSIEEVFGDTGPDQRELARSGEARALLRQLERKFGRPPQAAKARVCSASTPQLDLWLDRILDARTLEEVFGNP